MIESVHFRNFKVLRDTTLPLAPFSLIVGPNGSGKSTALQALSLIHNPSDINFQSVATAGLPSSDAVVVTIKWGPPYEGLETKVRWIQGGYEPPTHTRHGQTIVDPTDVEPVTAILAGVRIYSLDAKVIGNPVRIEPRLQLRQDGTFLAGVLDTLHGRSPKRFDELNAELRRWLPEFDRILFETAGQGIKSLVLSTRENKHIPATDLSQGTL